MLREHGSELCSELPVPLRVPGLQHQQALQVAALHEPVVHSESPRASGHEHLPGGVR